MLVEGVLLRVKLGRPALDAVELLQISREIKNTEAVLKSTRNVLDKTRRAASTEGTTENHECEQAALCYAAKKRSGMEAFFISEDVFHAFKRVFLDLVEEERVARCRLDDLHAETKKRAAKARSAEYFMGTKCVFERFAVEEEAREKKTKLFQEYSGFLTALRFAEEEERQEAIGRARARRRVSLQQPVAQSMPLNSFGQPGVMSPPVGLQQTARPQVPPQFAHQQPPYIAQTQPYGVPNNFFGRGQPMYQPQPQHMQASGYYAAAPNGRGGYNYGAQSAPPFQAPAQNIFPAQYQAFQQQQSPNTSWTAHSQAARGRTMYYGL
ncbi:hypothetical protein MOQ_004182 [Trypanosoma cruzi marinkellei]|uniref:Uncharacterized protein n=1 Tax=Trypanosoma cruzi marinkellei TaxID=85056 RepID=K2NAR9_TRYCR|nr:hypothetical protein MOQ_004182 [Trypanosoma cruzi marinkellei]